MRLLMAFAFALLLSFPAQAAFMDNPGGNGFAGPGQKHECTVQQAKQMRDDAKVAMTGKIVSRIGDDKYVFQDATGQITVEIDDEDFRGQTVTPQNTVRIYGEVDKEFGRAPEIDVKNLQVLQ